MLGKFRDLKRENKGLIGDLMGIRGKVGKGLGLGDWRGLSGGRIGKKGKVV